VGTEGDQSYSQSIVTRLATRYAVPGRRGLAHGDPHERLDRRTASADRGGFPAGGEVSRAVEHKPQRGRALQLAHPLPGHFEVSQEAGLRVSERSRADLAGLEQPDGVVVVVLERGQRDAGGVQLGVPGCFCGDKPLPCSGPGEHGEDFGGHVAVEVGAECQVIPGISVADDFSNLN
jgi:hypothetical protein